ncbi:hypothetical protein ACEPAI_9903 [Sanghuangporus weigelae]
MAANILLLVGTILLALAEVFLLCLAGYILGRMGILNKQTRKQVNILNTSIFTPALLFTKVAFSLTPAQLKELWIIPVLFILVTSVSAGTAYLAGLLFRIKPAHRNFAMAAAMFMNSNSMPIALMQSLIGTVSELKWNENDTREDMLGRALTYLVLFSTLGNIARWSFGVKILQRADDASETNDEGKKLDLESQQLTKETAHDSSPSPLAHSRSPSDATIIGDTRGSRSPRSGSREQFYLADVPARSGSSLPAESNVAREPSNPALPLSTKSSSATLAPFTLNPTMETKAQLDPIVEQKPPVPLQRFARGLKKSWNGFCGFMTMPLWAALLAIIIALIPPVQNLIANHMPPVRQALEMAGDCSIPLTLVVLGAYFYTPPSQGKVVPSLKERLRNVLRFRRSKNSEELAEGKPKRPGEKRTILVAIVSRQVLCPLIVLPLMLAFVRFNIPPVFADPVFVVSNVLLVSAPVALTLAQMSTKTGASDEFERLLSTTIFYAYCIVLTPVTIIYVVIGLILAKL